MPGIEWPGFELLLQLIAVYQSNFQEQAVINLLFTFQVLSTPNNDKKLLLDWTNIMSITIFYQQFQNNANFYQL